MHIFVLCSKRQTTSRHTSRQIHRQRDIATRMDRSNGASGTGVFYVLFCFVWFALFIHLALHSSISLIISEIGYAIKMFLISMLSVEYRNSIDMIQLLSAHFRFQKHRVQSALSFHFPPAASPPPPPTQLSRGMQTTLIVRCQSLSFRFYSVLLSQFARLVVSCLAPCVDDSTHRSVSLNVSVNSR